MTKNNLKKYINSNTITTTTNKFNYKLNTVLERQIFTLLFLFPFLLSPSLFPSSPLLTSGANIIEKDKKTREKNKCSNRSAEYFHGTTYLHLIKLNWISFNTCSSPGGGSPVSASLWCTPCLYLHKVRERCGIEARVIPPWARLASKDIAA